MYRYRERGRLAQYKNFNSRKTLPKVEQICWTYSNDKVEVLNLQKVTSTLSILFVIYRAMISLKKMDLISFQTLIRAIAIGPNLLVMDRQYRVLSTIITKPMQTMQFLISAEVELSKFIKLSRTIHERPKATE